MASRRPSRPATRSASCRPSPAARADGHRGVSAIRYTRQVRLAEVGEAGEGRPPGGGVAVRGAGGGGAVGGGHLPGARGGGLFVGGGRSKEGGGAGRGGGGG